MRLPRDTTRFKDLAAAFQSVAFIFAVLIGGAWTAWTFYWNVKDRHEQSAHDDEQKRIKEQGNLKLSLSVAPLRIEGADRPVNIRIDAQNSGDHPIQLDLTCDPVRVMVVKYGSDDLITDQLIQTLRPLPYISRPTSRPKPTKYPSSTVRAGGQQSYHFLTQLPKAGLYWITFSATEKVDDQPACPDLRSPPKPWSEEPGRDKGPRWSTGSLYVAR